MPFTLATWNINSVRLREGLVARLLAEEQPDVLCLQECKSPVDKMPLAAFADRYQAALATALFARLGVTPRGDAADTARQLVQDQLERDLLSHQHPEYRKT